MSETLVTPTTAGEQARSRLLQVPPEFLVWYARFQNGYVPKKREPFKFEENYCDTAYDHFLYEEVGDPASWLDGGRITDSPTVQDKVVFNVLDRCMYGSSGYVFAVRRSNITREALRVTGACLYTQERQHWRVMGCTVSDTLAAFIGMPTHEDISLKRNGQPETEAELTLRFSRLNAWIVHVGRNGRERDEVLHPLGDLVGRVNFCDPQKAYEQYLITAEVMATAEVLPYYRAAPPLGHAALTLHLAA